ncbi:putative nuclease HARBI1 [Nasonia vitripennis]|uniref:DDE Tnp4 domain-containing protein n=1 Tax=Nasonia vitripennis TaxID=7425 RepID=A0A7M7PVE6_NASVI|nr:putative nuclease HARBI1 [Nasonia vitripennis]
MIENEGRYYLLGDNGYTPSPILLTPIVDAPEGSLEAAYTHEHVSTRCKVEQCFGILTRVWLVISTARKLFYSPEKVTRIIIACAILHNYRKLNGMLDYLPPLQPEDENVQVHHRGNDDQAGLQERNNIINLMYN